MKVSVAMATYNGEKYIEKQLDSIRTQTRIVDEVIICDDRSTDGTASMIQQYIQKYKLSNWSIFINEQNKGFIGNFFGALKKVTGDVIFLSDQDDEWYKDKVEKMTNLIRQNKNIQALNSAVCLIDGEGREKEVIAKKGYCNANILHKAVKENELICMDVPFLIKSNVSPGCTMCITKALKEEFLKYEKLCVTSKFPHDWFLNTLAGIKKGSYFYNVPLIKYRIHEENTIGIDTDTQEAGKINSTREQRQQIGEFHKNRAILLDEELTFDEKDKAYVKKYRRFAERRDAFLKDFSFRKLLCVYKNVKIYYESISLRGMVSDLLYALGLDQKLR
ncbi:glycosyltransferase [Clostridium sp. CAG:411]|nr:glycosyltransferase family 2 protein [Lachnospiraceae bacterium]CDE45560.1 glycosyltransferase [Clostridium sp. CAG:411]